MRTGLHNLNFLICPSIEKYQIINYLTHCNLSDSNARVTSHQLRSNPEVGRNLKEQGIVNVSLTIIFSTLYTILVIIFAPISFQVMQVRVADALLPLSIIFGCPAIIGMTIGAFISNFFGGLGFVDMLGGALANFLATYVAWKLGQKQLTGIWIIAVIFEILLVTVIVGFYLSYLFGIHFTLSLLTILLGSTMSIGIIGYPLLLALSRRGIMKILKPRGVKLYIKKKSERA